MRKPGIIRCKDCLAYAPTDKLDDYASGFCCNATPGEYTYQVGDTMMRFSQPCVKDEQYCLQAVPREPGTCEDCCYGDAPPPTLGIEANYKPEYQWGCSYERQHGYTHRDHSCRHWRPCAEESND
jgi:hypothetical protein